VARKNLPHLSGEEEGFFGYLKAVRKGFWTVKVCGKLNSIARATA
jgi:hypothetical protein